MYMYMSVHYVPSGAYEPPEHVYMYMYMYIVYQLPIQCIYMYMYMSVHYVPYI